MDVMDFFKTDKPLKRIVYPGAQIGGIVNSTTELTIEDEIEEPVDDNHEPNTDYAEAFRQRDDEEFLERCSVMNALEDDKFNRPDSPSTRMTGPEIGEEEGNLDDIFSKYNFEHDVKPQLTINSYEDLIVNMVQTNPTVVIQGCTGCGKSTQVPQFILNAAQHNRKYCKIAVTQPRRIAAITVAKRVSQERGWPLGTVVGYQVGLDYKVGEDTVLTYMTTGVLLHQLVTARNMNMYTHIILDEVHERDQDMDFLMLVVKRYYRTVSPRVKIILMSATFDTQQFSNYFSWYSGQTLQPIPAPVIDIAKAPTHSVHMYYLDQFYHLISDTSKLDFQSDLAKLHTSLFPVVIKLLEVFDNLDKSENGCEHGSVLIFLPGIFEIEELYGLLENHKRKGVKWLLVPLHSSIMMEEQRKAFEESPKGYRKIILSTNIAESSVTVPDVVYVIDFCLTKILICDPASNYQSLKLTWASRSSCIQRAGRVGRVRSGRVYRFVNSKFFHEEMNERTIPEIMRSPLHLLVLLSKKLDLELPPHGVLALAMDPPDISNIAQTIDILKEVGALLTTCRGKYNYCDGDLTYLGTIMSILPLDIHFSKLIINGYICSTLNESIIMAAGMSLQNIFSSPFHERMKAYTSRLSWADGSCSDLIAYLHVYAVWERNKLTNAFGTSSGEKAWMQRNFLQPRVMREWQILVRDIKDRLTRVGIAEPTNRPNLPEAEKAMMLKVVISGAFYPNYFVRSSEGGQVDESMAVKILGGRDPYTTVYFTNKPLDQPMQLYTKSIRELLKDCGYNMHVSFDSSSKIYVQFKNDGVSERDRHLHGGYQPIMPGKIAVEVYRAIKYRQLNLPTVIHCLTPEDGRNRIRIWEDEQIEKNKYQISRMQSLIPTVETSIIEVQISCIHSPGHFYVHSIGDGENLKKLDCVNKILHTKPLEQVKNVTIGQVYAAYFQGLFYRARVICVVAAATSDVEVQVIYIDYGNCSCLYQSQLRMLPKEVQGYPEFALECVLSRVQPSLDMNEHGLWSKTANEEFYKKANNRKLYAKVYSVVDGVCSVDLYSKNSRLEKSLNSWMLENGLALAATESYLSQDDHKKREQAQLNNFQQIPSSSYRNNSETNFFEEIPSPRPVECPLTMTLKGPFSPLEMQVYGLVHCGQNKKIQIEWNSVNSVLLDSDPQDGQDRLLVAGSISQNVDGTRLTLRHTTIMPNIRGFPVLMTLIFTPKAQLHGNIAGTRITSILCGLGHDPLVMKSYFPKHDLIMNLDFELAREDMILVNEIREYMNMSIQALSCYKSEIQPAAAIECCQDEIRKKIKALLLRPRKSCERELLPNARTWGSISEQEEHMEIITGNANDIWPMHSFLKLDDNPNEGVDKHLEQLHDMATCTVPMSEVTCQLCNIQMFHVYEIRIHLVSTQHLENVKKVTN